LDDPQQTFRLGGNDPPNLEEGQSVREAVAGFGVREYVASKRRSTECPPQPERAAWVRTSGSPVGGNPDTILEAVLLDLFAQVLPAQRHVVDRTHVNGDDGALGAALYAHSRKKNDRRSRTGRLHRSTPKAGSGTLRTKG
jgi:hypothetical protein